MKGHKICPNCQNELELSVKFCNKCGTAQENHPEPSQASTSEPTQANVQNSDKKKNPLPMIGLATCFLLSAVILGSALGKKEESAVSVPTPPAVQTETSIESEKVVEKVEKPDEENTTEILPLETTPEPEPQPEPIKGVDMTGVERKQLYVEKAVASSTFPTWQHITYGADNTMDGSTDTAWVENADGIGVGEWLEHQFGSTQVVQEIQFYNGYGSAFDQNGVSTQVAVSLSGGETFLYDVVGHWNTLVLPYALESTSVRITILEAYSSRDQDTCISEMMIYNKSEEDVTTFWDAAKILENMESYGDISALSPQQAQAFANEIRNEKEIHSNMMSDNLQWVQQWGGEEYLQDVPFRASLFSAGNGIPGLLIQRAGIMVFGEVATIQQVYLWDGTSAYRYTTGSEYEDFGKLYFCGVVKKNGEYCLGLDTSMVGFTGGDIGTGGIWGSSMYISLKNGREVDTLEGNTFNLLLSSSAFSSEYENPIGLIDDIASMPLMQQVDFNSFKEKIQNTVYDVEMWCYITHLFVDGKYKGAYWTEYDVETNENIFVSPDGITEADLPEVIWEMPEYTDEDIATPKIDGLRFASLLDGYASSI